MLDAHNVYEIKFDIAADFREPFESWLSSEVVEWAGHEAVAHFEVFRNDTGLSPELKFVFGFQTLRDWASFVNSEINEAALDRLETIADHRNAILWQRTSVTLEEPADSPRSDGGNPDRHRDSRLVTVV